MKFSQAMSMLEQGKKIRRASWHTETFLYIESGKMLTTHGNRCRAFEPDELMADDWELYEEPKKKRIVKMWPAIIKAGDNDCYISSYLYCSIESAKSANRHTVRLLTEYPAIEIETDGIE